MHNFFLTRSLQSKVLCTIYKLLDRKHSVNKPSINKDNNCEYMYGTTWLIVVQDLTISGSNAGNKCNFNYTDGHFQVWALLMSQDVNHRVRSAAINLLSLTQPRMNTYFIPNKRWKCEWKLLWKWYISDLGRWRVYPADIQIILPWY